MADITFVSIDDWLGLYIDGELDWEYPSMSTKELLDRVAPEVNYIAADGTELERQAEEVGGLPKRLEDAVALIG